MRNQELSLAISLAKAIDKKEVIIEENCKSIIDYMNNPDNATSLKAK